MYYNISIMRAGSDDWFDAGETYTDFGAANKDAQEVFNDHAGYYPAYDFDGCYRCDETGVQVMVVEAD